MAVARSEGFHASAQSLGLNDKKESRRRTVVTSPDGEKDLADVHTRNASVGLTPRTAHTRLQSIGTGARQHLVDADDVVWMSADTKMETFFSGDFDEVSEGRPLDIDT